MKMLPGSFFKKPTLEVAKNLLGKTLKSKTGKRIIKGVITETEAYVGPEDKASHASRGKTRRTEVMFGEAGTIYIYLIYGMHHCLNIVTEKDGYPAAVLIRAVKYGDKIINGPGRVTKYFALTKKFNRRVLSRKTGLWIENGAGISRKKIKTGKRIGVDYAGAWAKKPWRFYVAQTTVRR